jgi:hypothetical protein
MWSRGNCMLLGETEEALDTKTKRGTGAPRHLSVSGSGQQTLFFAVSGSVLQEKYGGIQFHIPVGIRPGGAKQPTRHLSSG